MRFSSGSASLAGSAVTNETLLIDRLFAPSAAIHANGGRQDFKPRHVQWTRVQEISQRSDPVGRPVWLTDADLFRAPELRRLGYTVVGLLLEPPQLHPEDYERARELVADHAFSRLYTSHPDEFASVATAPLFVHPYPHGGTRLHPSDWRRVEKRGDAIASIVASPKRTADGHKLRHDVIRQARALGLSVDAYGPEYQPLEHKAEALLPYRYTIAIENANTGLWFTEAVVDAFLSFTLPIYWGSKEALSYWGFDPNGVIWVSDLDHLIDVLRSLSAFGVAERTYSLAATALQHNYLKAHEYTCIEDWLYRGAPFLFGAGR